MTGAKALPAFDSRATGCSKHGTRLATAILLTTLATAMLSASLLREHHWATAALLYLPYVLLLAPALLALGLSFRLTVAWRAASAVGVGLVLSYGMGFELPAGAEDGHTRLRVMTYNIKGYIAFDDPINLRLISLELARHDPDVLMMQDARQVGRLTPADRNALIGNRILHIFGQYAIASRHPLRECATGSIAFRGIPHTYASCVLSVGGRDIDLITAHLLTPRDGLNALREEGLAGIAEWKQNVADRREQAEALADAVRRRARPTILAGDLNAPARSLVMERLRDAGLHDAFSSAGFGYGYTYGHSLRPGWTFLRIDHIMVSPEIGVVDAFTGASPASPHLAVIADLHLDRIDPHHTSREPRT